MYYLVTVSFKVFSVLFLLGLEILFSGVQRQAIFNLFIFLTLVSDPFRSFALCIWELSFPPLFFFWNLKELVHFRLFKKQLPYILCHMPTFFFFFYCWRLSAEKFHEKTAKLNQIFIACYRISFCLK